MTPVERVDNRFMTDFAWDYLLFVSFSALGVLLTVTAYSRLNGVLLFGRRLSMLIGALLILGAFAWFFLSAPRNQPDTGVGLNGNEQALLFSAGAGAALVLVLALSSLRNWSMVGSSHHLGMEALRHSSYLRTLLRGLRLHWAHYYRRTKGRFSG